MANLIGMQTMMVLSRDPIIRGSLLHHSIQMLKPLMQGPGRKHYVLVSLYPCDRPLISHLHYSQIGIHYFCQKSELWGCGYDAKSISNYLVSK